MGYRILDKEGVIKIMKRNITSIGTGASIISLAFIPGVPTWARWIIGIIGAICVGMLAYDDYKSNQPDENEMVCTNETEIKEEMIKLIKTQGKICIMSRDLSWVEKDVMDCIINKKDSVKIFAQAENETTRKLVDAGVAVRYYGSTGFEPLTRFTILRPKKPDSQVAIAMTNSQLKKKKKKTFEHIIYLTGGKHADKRDRWITSLATDMMELCDKVSTSNSEGEDGTKKP